MWDLPSLSVSGYQHTCLLMFILAATRAISDLLIHQSNILHVKPQQHLDHLDNPVVLWSGHSPSRKTVKQHFGNCNRKGAGYEQVETVVVSPQGDADMMKTGGGDVSFGEALGSEIK